jgi:hypothetical protein
MLKNCLSSLHEKQAEALRAGVTAATEGEGRLSLSQLAQRISGQVALRYRVKRMDRLLGNEAIHARRGEIYGSLTQGWLKEIGPLLIVADRSPVTADQKWQVLRASVAVEGRSVTLYEAVHPQHRLRSRWVQQRFLGSLARLIPAGFRSPRWIVGIGLGLAVSAIEIRSASRAARGSRSKIGTPQPRKKLGRGSRFCM